MTTVRQVFKITDEELERLEVKAEDSEYWMKCHEFIQQIIDQKYEYLTDKQTEWLERIMNEIQRGGD